MKRLVSLTLALAFLLGSAPVILAAGPMGAPGTNVNAPAGAVRGSWDDFFRTPATPQDMALSQAVTSRMQQWKDPSLAQASSAKPGVETQCGLCGVTVEARNGYIRLSGHVATLQQSMAAENIARSTQGAAAVINAVTIGK